MSVCWEPCERRIDARVDWTMVAEIEMLGLDEIALKKGQGHYVTLITDRFEDGELVILGVLPGHEKAVVVEFLCLIPQSSIPSTKLTKAGQFLVWRYLPTTFILHQLTIKMFLHGAHLQR